MFAHLEDVSGRIQLYLRATQLARIGRWSSCSTSTITSA